MQKTFKAQNISCSKCANLIKVSLEDKFGKVEVNLDVNPKEVTLIIKSEEKEKLFKTEMSDIGFDIIED